MFRSPLTDNLTFTGHEQIDGLIAVIFDVLKNVTYTDELHGDHTAVLVGNAIVDGIRLQFCDHLTLRDDGLIEEMTVFFRPLPATTAAMRRIGEALGAQHSPLRGRTIGALTMPLAAMARSGDQVGVRLLRP